MSILNKMPIKVKKRKVSESSDQIPEKKLKNYEVADEDDEPVKDVPSVNKSINFDKPLNVKIFRANLQKHFSLTDVQHFVHVATKDPSYVRRYIQAGGKILELVELIEKIDKNHIDSVKIIFSAIQLNLIELLTQNDDKQIAPAIQAIKFLLKSYKSSLENMLRSIVIELNKIAVKLLTAIVALDTELGKTVLSIVEVIADAENLRKYTNHIKYRESSHDSLRTCFIHFILAYMIEGNSTLMRKIVEKKNIMTSILNGLYYDDHETVTLVIKTLLKYFVMQSTISKTEKIHLFEFNVIQDMIRLYNWEGPRGLLGKTQMANMVDERVNESKADVKECVHEFLKVLLASRRHGIATSALLDVKHKKNWTQSRVISSIAVNWADKYQSDLIIEVLQACPELTSYFFIKACKSFERNPPETFEFLIRLVAAIKLHHLSYAKNYLKIIDTIDISLSIFFSNECFQLIQHHIVSDSFILRVLSKRLLFTMFQSCREFFNDLKSWSVYRDHELNRMRFDCIQRITTYCPSIDTIITSVYKSLEQMDNPEVNIVEHLELTLDLLQFVYGFYPLFFEKTSSAINYIQMLKPIYNSTERNCRLELKMVNFILEVEPESISPATQLFEEIFVSFTRIFVCGEREDREKARVSLTRILLNTGLFENGVDEIDLWLSALKPFTVDQLEQISNYLIKTVRSMKASDIAELTAYHKKYATSSVANDFVSKNIAQLFTNIDNDVTVQGVMDVPTLSNVFIVGLMGVTKKEKKITEYFQQLGIYLWFYLPNHEILAEIFTKEKSIDFMAHIQTTIEMDPFLFAVKNALASSKSSRQSLVKLFEQTGTGIKYTIDEDECEFCENLSETVDIKMFIYFTVTHILEANETGVNSTDILTTFLQILKQNDHASYQTMLKYIFTSHNKILQHFDVVSKKRAHFSTFVVDLIRSLAIELNVTTHYRNKIVNQLKIAASDRKKLTDQTLEVLTIFKMSDENCIDILENLLSIFGEVDQFVGHQVYFEVIVYCLKRIADLGLAYPSRDSIVKLADLYVRMIQSSHEFGCLERLEDGMLVYFERFVHAIDDISTSSFFISIFESRKPTKSTSKLGKFFLERQPKFNQVFLSLIDKNYTKKEIFYPVLSAALAKNLQIDQALLTKIYGEYKTGILKSIEKPSKAGAIYREHFECSIKLIELCMPANECLDFCRKSLKLDSSEIFQTLLIRAIHLKTIKSFKDNLESGKVAFVNFIQTWIQLISFHLKKDPVDFMKINSMIVIVFNWINDLKRFFPDVSYEKITQNQVWSNFCRSSLKIGMSATSVGVENSILLKIMAYFCDNFYADGVESVTCAEFYDLATSHSNFFELMLNPEKNHAGKTNFVYLLFVLVHKNPTVISSKHIPVLLGSYNATLSNCDRYILAMIQLYERNGISLYEFRPFLWGETAISHYALRNTEDDVNRVINEPAMYTVQSLFDTEMCDTSIELFPVWRKLDTLDQLPAVDFDGYGCEIEGEYHPGKFYQSLNTVERIVEKGDRHFDRDFLKILPSKGHSFDNVYDPAFIVPLLSLVFAPESFSYPSITASNGSLSLLIASLSSLDHNIRLGAGNALLRYRNHFENNRNFYDKPLWVHMFDSMQSGLASLSSQQAGTVARVPYPSGLFLAKTTNILSYPTSVMYQPLTNSLLFKKHLDFSRVPEFTILLESNDVKHVNHRYFILNVVKNGIKCARDFEVIHGSHVLKSVMGLFAASYSDKTVDLQILSIINNCVKIPKLVIPMIEQFGVLSWLAGVIDGVESFKYDTIDGIIYIMNNIWYSMVITRTEARKRIEIEQNLFVLHMKLLPKLSQQISLASLAKYLNILVQISQYKLEIIDRSQLDKLLDCLRLHFEVNVFNEIEYLYKCGGGEFADDRLVYVKKLKSLNGIDDSMISTLGNLRQFIINWTKTVK